LNIWATECFNKDNETLLEEVLRDAFHASGLDQPAYITNATNCTTQRRATSESHFTFYVPVPYDTAAQAKATILGSDALGALGDVGASSVTNATITDGEVMYSTADGVDCEVNRTNYTDGPCQGSGCGRKTRTYEIVTPAMYGGKCEYATLIACDCGSSELEGGPIAGIVIAVLVFVGLSFFLIWYCCLRKKPAPKKKEPDEPGDTAPEAVDMTVHA
jgi:hypothetical protein